MQWCFNQITAGRQAPDDPARDLAAMREGGWRAIELWLRHWDGFIEREGTEAARRRLDDAGLTAAGACAQGGLFFSSGEERQRYRDELARRLEQCQALGAPHLVITPGAPRAPAGEAPRRPAAGDLKVAADNLRTAGDLAARYGVRLGIEFLKGAWFVNNLPTVLLLARQVDHPQVGVVVDTFHLYAGLSKVEDLDLLKDAPGRLFFVHANDVPATTPRELWTDADRVLPGEGAFPLGAMFDGLRRAGYSGFVSLELFNDTFADRWADDPVAASRLACERATQALPEAPR
ncbi:MAG: sugar phosphate isomerase/epimerase family protein [Chloroflexota bacterium]